MKKKNKGMNKQQQPNFGIHDTFTHCPRVYKKKKKKKKMISFKGNENIHKNEDWSYYVVSANKASSTTLKWAGNESQRKHNSILRISTKQSIQRLI